MNNNIKNDRVIVKFLTYTVFISIIIILVIITGGKSKNIDSEMNEIIESEEEISKVTYIDMQKRLVSGDYEYEFIISGDNLNIKFGGTSVSGERTGYRDNNGDITKYKRLSNQIFLLETHEEINYSEFYTKLDSNLFDFTHLFDKLNRASTIIDKTSSGKIYNYLDVDNYRVKVYLNSEFITRMIVENANTTYDFNFTY